MLLMMERIKSATHASNAAVFLANVDARYGMVTSTLGSSIKFVKEFGVMCDMFCERCLCPHSLGRLKCQVATHARDHRYLA
jgi:hypothetical protein